MSPMISKASQEAPTDNAFSKPLRRRQVLAAAGAAAAALVDAQEAHALTLTDYFNILATGEALFVTFYENALQNQAALALHGQVYDALWAILTEEQIHYDYARSRGGTAATLLFSMPHGKDTFTRPDFFWQTQQLAEELTNAALLAWIGDMAAAGHWRLAQVGGELMQVEGGHRAVGRAATHARPWENWAFGLRNPNVKSFTDVPAAVKAAGFLSPTAGNQFSFTPLGNFHSGVVNTNPAAMAVA